MDFQEIITALKSKYSNDFIQEDSNHWHFRVMTGEGRSQEVHVLYKQKRVGDVDISRFIVESPIGLVHRHLNLEFVLRKNTDLDVGAICIHDLRNEENLSVPYLTLRGTHLIPTADPEEVFEMIEKVARGADLLEKDLYARDFH